MSATVSRSYVMRCLEEPDITTATVAAMAAIAHFFIGSSDFSWMVRFTIGTPFAYALIMLSTDFAADKVFRVSRMNYYGGYITSLMLGIPCTELQRHGSTHVKTQTTLVLIFMMWLLTFHGFGLVSYTYITMIAASVWITHTLPSLVNKPFPVPWHRQRLARRLYIEQ